VLTDSGVSELFERVLNRLLKFTKRIKRLA